MRVSQAEMDQSHQRIVEGAAGLMRKQGIERTSVNDVMEKAGLTHGGFYRHFDSKETLVSAALETAFDEILDGIDKAFRAQGLKQGARKYYRHYLSEDHRKQPEAGCPIAALGQDVARSNATVKKTFSEGVNRVVEKLALAEDGGTRKEKRMAAMRKISMLAGAIMIARASDAETARAVLEACQTV